jgi:ABC-type antimicrobial peptide transport system permease subunit
MKEKALNKITLLAILICSYCNAQTSDFIVSASRDTIYVDKINVTNFEVKTKTGDKKKKYNIDEIISYYISKENKHYERISPEKKEPKEADKYDYRRNENLYSDEYESRIKYKFLQRLTVGKVKLFAEVYRGASPGTGSPGQAGFVPAAPYENKIYYISIYDSRLELIKNKAGLKIFDFSKGLELNKEVFEILKIYLYGNNEINVKLNNLFISKPIAKEKQIIDLINEYNIWARSNR